MGAPVVDNRLKQRFDKWDANSDGVLDRSDFEQEAERIARAFGSSTGTGAGKALAESFRGLHDYLVQQSGSQQITEQQFMQATEKLIFQEGESGFNRLMRPVVQAIVGLCDKNADGKISREEFAVWLTAVGVPDSQAKSAFDRIDADHSGELSADELLGAVRKFHFGELDVALLG
ncbi:MULTISPECIES: EF-hand domain-containing protein [Amycolatopsis]|uniref:EF-hand domain-containing protein n=1 Tax=Amycolatopsis thermalba TaxID=944492 RepID=A0ABY4NXD9_9PSEU|nr:MULTISPECIES: EF-hand domain-containing protein [Amycolatopsis]OXM72314.1 signal transduction protein [Amycolatopsis sp. KNN50.9b]UQS24745.1 EF-hand domain-containing protein [Amycolatopsis thermalba]